MTTYFTTVNSPIDDLLLMADSDGFVIGCAMHQQRHAPIPAPEWRRDDKILRNAAVQLHAYFAGELTSFDLPLKTDGTTFQTKVWHGLQGIPYGTTISYGDLANSIGHPKAFRAVGTANGHNPLAIIIPCHRVIAAQGGLGGYGGGLDRKRQLLALESNVTGQPTPDWD